MQVVLINCARYELSINTIGALEFDRSRKSAQLHASKVADAPCDQGAKRHHKKSEKNWREKVCQKKSCAELHTQKVKVLN